MARASEPRRAVSIALFAVLGLVGAFLVSTIASLGGDEGRGGADPVAGAVVPGGGGERADGVAGPALALGEEDRAETRVEVLNGAGTSGLARDATHRLRGVGFDVVYFGNATSFGRGRSVVLDRTGRLDRARAVAAALAIDSVASEPDASLLLDVTVMLGGDWPPVAPVRKTFADRFREVVGNAVP